MASDTVDQKMHDANTYVDGKRQDLEKVRFLEVLKLKTNNDWKQKQFIIDGTKCGT